jgi:hypothetical protein
MRLRIKDVITERRLRQLQEEARPDPHDKAA